MINLIGISGKMGSGKDEVGRIFQELTISKFYGQDGLILPFYEIKKFAYKVKQVAALLTNIEVEKFEDQDFKAKELSDDWFFDNHTLTGRELLQKVGTEMGRSIHPDTWVNALFSEYVHDLRRRQNPEGGTTISEGFPNWIITDVRFPNEADIIKEKGGIMIRINRPTDIAGGHASETSLDDYDEFDLVIENDGSLDDLYLKVETIYNSFN